MDERSPRTRLSTRGIRACLIRRSWSRWASSWNATGSRRPDPRSHRSAWRSDGDPALAGSGLPASLPRLPHRRAPSSSLGSKGLRRGDSPDARGRRFSRSILRARANTARLDRSMGLTAGSRDPHARASCWSVTPRRRATPRGDAISLARCATSGCYETRYWQRAASEYARHHDNAFAELRAAERLCAELFMAIGSDADAARARPESAKQRLGRRRH